MTTPVPVLKISIYDKIKTAIFLEVQRIPSFVKVPEQLTPAQVVAIGAMCGAGTIGRVVQGESEDVLEITLSSPVTIAYDEVRGFVANWTASPKDAPAANRLEDLRREAAVPVGNSSEIPNSSGDPINSASYGDLLVEIARLRDAAEKEDIAHSVTIDQRDAREEDLNQLFVALDMNEFEREWTNGESPVTRAIEIAESLVAKASGR